MDRFKAYLLPAAAALLLLAYYLWRWTSGEPVAEPPAKTPAAPRGATPEPKATPSSEPVPLETDAPQAETDVPQAELRAPSPEPTRARARAKRDALRDQIAQAQRQRLGREPTPSEDDEALGQLTREYLQQRIREDLIPLAQECYELALDDDDALAGRMALQFRIVGEPELGGLVEEVQLTADSDLRDPDLVECMSESMLSMSFDPPEGGGVLEVTYPFEFRPGGPEGPDEPARP